MSDEEWSRLSFENSELRSENDRLTAEVAALKTEVKTANTRLEAEQWARKHVKSVIVSDLEKALSEAQAEAARLTAEVAKWKDKSKTNEDALLRHAEICVGHFGKIATLEAEAARLRKALQGCVDAYDFVAKDPYDTGLEPIHDAAQIARSALRGEEG